MKLEPTEMWTEAEKLMTEYVNVWSVLKDYNEGLHFYNNFINFFIVYYNDNDIFLEFDAISEQEWIVFQKKLHLLDEFVSKWSGKLEPFTVVTLFIQQELEKYAVSAVIHFIYFCCFITFCL